MGVVLDEVLLDAQRLTVFGAVLLIAAALTYAGRQVVVATQTRANGTNLELRLRRRNAANAVHSVFVRRSVAHRVRKPHRTSRAPWGNGVPQYADRHRARPTRQPIWERVQRAALRLRPIQQGRLHVYLLYVVAALVGVLAYLMATS